MLNPYSINGSNAWMCDVVVMFSDGTRLVGEYDGYGGVSDRDILEGPGDPCCYHQSCWVVAGKPKYNGGSPPAQDQGYFFDRGAHTMKDPLRKGQGFR